MIQMGREIRKEKVENMDTIHTSDRSDKVDNFVRIYHEYLNLEKYCALASGSI